MENEATEVEQPSMMISEENAKAQIAKLFGYYEIDIEDYDGIEIKGTKVKKSLMFAKKKLLKAFRHGRLELTSDDRGRVLITQHLAIKYRAMSKITYYPINASHKITMGNVSSDNDNEQMYALLAAMAKVEPSTFNTLEGKDLTTAECLGQFFLLG